MELLFLYKLGFGGFFGCSECFPLPLGDQAIGMRVQTLLQSWSMEKWDRCT